MATVQDALKRLRTASSAADKAADALGQVEGGDYSADERAMRIAALDIQSTAVGIEKTLYAD